MEEAFQGVEAERCASFSAALKAGHPVYVKAESTLADGLAVPKVGVNAYATAAPLVDKVGVAGGRGCADVLLGMGDGRAWGDWRVRAGWV